VELPIDGPMIGAILENARTFWANHVIPSIPPVDKSPAQPVIAKQSGGKYDQIEGDAWRKAVDQLLLAKEQEIMAKIRIASAKETITTAMAELGKTAVQMGQHKFLYREVPGRKTFDKKALQADFPDLDLTKYERQGSPFHLFNHYGPKDSMKGDVAGDGSSIMSIHMELEEIANKKLDSDAAMMLFDDVRSRAELYASILEMDLAAIRSGINQAADVVTKKLIK
jgi:hypothetical protein